MGFILDNSLNNGIVNYGFDEETINVDAVITSASNIVTGTNPAYAITDFLNIYPQFVQSASVTGAFTLGSATVTVPSTFNLYVGSPISGTGIPLGSIISTIVDAVTITISHNATVNGTAITLNQLLLPNMVMQMYINLANASIIQNRWQSYWQLGMSLFTAHFCTLYLQSTLNANAGASAVLAAGQAKGLDVSQSVGDVSVSTDYSIVAQSIGSWAQYNLTIFGQQLASIGKLMGKGNIYVY